MKFYLFTSIVLLFIACQSQQNNTPSESATTGTFDEFIDFYQEFHADSLYQIEHILFPLQGIPTQADSVILASNNFYWQRDDWTMHRPINTDSEFNQQFVPVDEQLIIEKIIHKSGQYAMERRFSKIGDQWKLIYYAGLNRVSVR